MGWGARAMTSCVRVSVRVRMMVAPNTAVGDTVSFEDITTAGAGVTLALVAGGGTATGQSTTVVSTVENLTGTPNRPIV